MKTNPETTPNPGTQAAIDAGCKCPVVDNHYGAGYHGNPDVFIYNGNCPVHAAVIARTKAKHVPLYQIIRNELGCIWPQNLANMFDLIADQVEERGDKKLELDPGEVAEWLRGEAELAREA